MASDEQQEFVIALHPCAVAALGATLWELGKIAYDYTRMSQPNRGIAQHWQEYAIVAASACRVFFYLLWLADVWSFGYSDSVAFKLLLYVPTALFVPVISTLFFDDLGRAVGVCALELIRTC